MALIVVHRHDAVELPGGGAAKQGIGRPGPADGRAVAGRTLHGRPDDALFLVAEQPAVAGVRVQGGDANPRLASLQPQQQSVEQGDLFPHGLRAQVFEYVAQGHVQGHVGDGDLAIVEHHGEFARLGALGQDFRVAGVVQARGSQPFFVQRRRDDGVRFAGQGQIDGGTEKVVCRPPCIGRNLP